MFHQIKMPPAKVIAALDADIRASVCRVLILTERYVSAELERLSFSTGQAW
jgi:hypothetical protein